MDFAGGRRAVLYYGYEHPWMLACPEQWKFVTFLLLCHNQSRVPGSFEVKL
jgi:hypothetical protein